MSKIIYCSSADTTLLGELLRLEYEVKYVADLSAYTHLSDAFPLAIILDQDGIHEADIVKIQKSFNNHPKIIVRSDVLFHMMDGVVSLPKNTSNSDLIKHISTSFISPKVGSQHSRKILIIEDNTNINEMYQIAFTQAGCEVRSAYDGLSGITTAAEFHPDVILLDLMMPNMDGFEMLKVLKNNTSLTTKVIVNSNLEGVDEENKARAMGADGFLKKSMYTPIEVVEMIMTGKL